MTSFIKWRYILLLCFFQMGVSANATPNIQSSGANAVSIQKNGTIVAAGYVMLNGINQLMVAQITPFGTIDTIFGNNGYVATPIGSLANATAIKIISNDQPVIAGLGQVSSGTAFALARYNWNGTLDTTFNDNGIVTQFIGSGACAYGITVDSSNRYVVAGTSIINNAPIITVVRYNTNGTLDTSFGNNGVAIKRIFGNAGAYDVALQNSGKIIAAGYTVNSGTREFGLVRFNTDGAVDTTFGNSGTITTAIGSDSCAYAMTVQPNNYIIAAGVSNAKFALARYMTNGSLDTTFGSGGIVTNSVGLIAQINDVALQNDGKIVAVGFSDTSIALARYTTNGTLDSTFGLNGIVTTAVDSTAIGSSVVIQRNGQIVVAGSSNNGTIVLRYNANGSLDNTFGNNGLINFPNNYDAPDIFGIIDVNIADSANISYSKLNLNKSIMDSDISMNAHIADTKLAPIQSPGVVLNTATTATSFDLPNAIVARDAFGNFNANVIFSDVVGNVRGNASENLLKSGDTMSGVLVLPGGSSVVPSLQFSGNKKTGLSASLDILSLSTKGLERIAVDANGSVTINAPNAGSALRVQGETLIAGDISNGGNIIFNTDVLSLNSVGSTQGPLMKLYGGIGNTGLQGMVIVDYTAAGFSSIPIICITPLNGVSVQLTIKSITNTSAIIMSGATLNVPFNYIAMGI